jgi:hypothetical protein
VWHLLPHLRYALEDLMLRTSARAGALVAGLALTLVSGLPAVAHDGDVERRGSCSGWATWKLKVKPDDGRLEVEGEVDANHRGQTWKWQIRHDGDVSFRGRKTTSGSSGSFEVERRVVNSPGRDGIGWRAVNVRSGQRCHGSVAI